MTRPSSYFAWLFSKSSSSKLRAEEFSLFLTESLQFKKVSFCFPDVKDAKIETRGLIVLELALIVLHWRKHLNMIVVRWWVPYDYISPVIFGPSFWHREKITPSTSFWRSNLHSVLFNTHLFVFSSLQCLQNQVQISVTLVSLLLGSIFVTVLHS